MVLLSKLLQQPPAQLNSTMQFAARPGEFIFFSNCNRHSQLDKLAESALAQDP